MAYRGRGRGRFGGGGGFAFARQEPSVLFPEVELPNPKDVKEERMLVLWNVRLTNFFKNSPYYLEEIVSKESQSMDIERFSDMGKPKITSERDSLDQFLQLTSKNFPKELIGGFKRRRPKKVRWNADMQKLDVFEKLELKYQGQSEKGETEKKEGEDEEEDEDEEPEGHEEDYDDDGDYNQNIDFDDDEDDYNMDDGNDDEPTY